MADTPVAAPSAPAGSAAPAGAQPQGQPAPRPHHSSAQPREQGKFAGAPVPGGTPPAPGSVQSEPPKPKAWKLGDREVTDPDELYVEASANRVQRDAYEKLLQEREELRQWKERVSKDKKALFQDPEEARRFAIEQIRQQIEEESMTPEQRARRQEQRELQALREERQRLQQEAQQAAEQQAVEAARAEFVTFAREAMKAGGLDETDENLKRFTRVFRANLTKGLNYPPHVVARQVARLREQELHADVERLEPKALLTKLPQVLKKLDAVDDAELLRALAKALPNLGEKLRRLNLESLGAAPAAAARPVGAQLAQPSTPHEAKFQRLMAKPQEQWDHRDYHLATELRLKGFPVPG